MNHMKKQGFIAFVFVLASCDGGIGVQTSTAESAASTCDHGVCVPGDPLSTTCNACSAAVCKQDSYCCNVAWDNICVTEADRFCNGTCQTSCSVGQVSIVDFATWNKTLPAPAGRQVLVMGPWTDPTHMSISVYQENSDQVVLVITLLRADFSKFFANVAIGNTVGFAGKGPGIPPYPSPPPGPIGIPTIIAASQALARKTRDIDQTACSIGPGLP